MVNRPKPVVLLILDGFGYSLDKEYNAIAMANTSCWDRLQKDWLMTLRCCCGDAILCNYANCGMVGHTGIIDAAVLAVEAVDASIQRIVHALKSVGGQMRITAGHGNIEQMVDKESGQPHTAHTTNPVSLLYAGGDKPLDAGGSLSDLASTVLAMLGVGQPVEMTGRSLIKVA
jgi:bisphosphoglycerate-independent phosphoglycerate mutase (AlkP superfamily)